MGKGMLNKKVCKYCLIHFRDSLGWVDFDEKHWMEEKIVFCPYKVDYAHVATSISNEPPKRCPYHLEHLVNESC